MGKKYLIKKKNYEILALKKDTPATVIIAKDADVLKAIKKFNKKHYELMCRLAE